MVKQSDPDPPMEIPAWLMTYSDVITLLMTFFILLLTFATNEPESFDRMPVSLFGGGGATGIAGDAESKIDRDALLLRERPRSGRISMRGSEIPPVNSDPTTDAMAEGLAGLESNEERELSTQHSVTIPLALLIDSSGKVTSTGLQQLRQIAKQLHKQELDVEFFVADNSRITDVLKLTDYLYQQEHVLPGRLGVGRETTPMDPTLLKIVLTRPVASWTDGVHAKTR